MSQPLAGKRIVVTRSRKQAASFADKLAARGAKPVYFPVIQFERMPTGELDAALTDLSGYDWLLFTSANAVDFFFQRVDELDGAYRLPPVAASGSATAAKLAERGVEVSFIPDEFVGESLVAGLGAVDGMAILLPRARIGRPKIAAMLRERGAHVDDIGLYDTVTAVAAPEALLELGRGFDAITFTSPSSVRNYLKLARAHDLTPIPTGVVVASIGPITTAEIEKQGLTTAVQPAEYTIDGIVAALCDYYEPHDA